MSAETVVVLGNSFHFLDTIISGKQLKCQFCNGTEFGIQTSLAQGKGDFLRAVTTPQRKLSGEEGEEGPGDRSTVL